MRISDWSSDVCSSDLAVVLDDAEHDRQAQAGPLANRLGRVERLEDALPHLHANAAAGVEDADRDAVVFGLRMQIDATLAFDRLAGIGVQVEEELVQLRRRTFDLWQLDVLAHDAEIGSATV